MKLAEILLTIMVALQPPGRSLYSLTEVEEGSPPACQEKNSFLCQPPKWNGKAWIRPESEAEGVERYRLIAETIASVAGTTDLTEWGGTSDDLARYILTITFHESGWRKDVHSGKGLYARGDNGKSWCLGQIMLGRDGRKKTARGYRAREIVGVDAEATRKCIETVADVLTGSGKNCKIKTSACVLKNYGGGGPNVPDAPIRMRSGTWQKALIMWKKLEKEQ